MKRYICALRAILAVTTIACWTAPVSAGTLMRHSWTNNMATGDFDGDGAADVAWILPSGDIQVYGPSTDRVRLVSGANAFALVGAEMTSGGDGLHEVVYLSQTNANTGVADPQEIRVYSPAFWTNTLHPGAAAFSSKLTAGDWNNDGDDGIVVTGNNGAIYGSEDGVFNSPNNSGALAAYVAGDFNVGRAGEEFIGYNTGGTAYYYNGGTSNSYTAIGGGGISGVTAADVNPAAPGTEMLVIANSTQFYRWNSTSSYALLPGGGVGVGAGNLAGGQDEWIVIGNAPGNLLYRFAGNSAWAAVGGANNADWADFVAADFDGDGSDEVFGIKHDGSPHYYDPGTMGDFQAVTVPAPPAPLPVATGATLWLDASDASTIVPGGGGVQMWIDKSGDGHHATQGNAAAQPVVNATAVNGQPAVRFDGSDDGMVIDDSLVLGRPYTVFTVDQYYGGTQGRTLQGRAANWLTGKWAGKNAHYANGFVYNPAGGAGIDNPAIGDAVGNPTSSEYLVNGRNVTASTAPLGNPGQLGLVGGGAFNEQSQADVAEVIVFDRVLSYYERAQVGQYLGEKYGLQTAYSTGLATRAQVFTGADSGEGLDMQGSFLHAVNARGPAGAVIGDATFTDDAGVITSEYEILNWIAPNYGPTADDAALSGVMQSIRWTDSDNGGQESVDVTLPNLVAGRTYKVQMLFADAATDRHFAVDVEGSRVVGDFQVAAMTGAGLELGAVLTHEFVATDDTLNVVLNGSGLPGADINPILQAITVEDRGITGATTAGTFNGGDPGEGLAIGAFTKYAVNVGGPGGFEVDGVTFTADDATPGVTVSAEHQITGWINPDYGTSPSDDGLEGIMSSIRWTATNARGEVLSVEMEDLEVGEDYVLQLLFGEGASTRGFDVVVDGVLVADEFSPTAEGVNANVGVVLSHEFTATGDTLSVVLDGYPAAFGDRNPILNGFTLARVVPEPSTFVLAGLGLLGLLVLRRRRK